MTDTERPYPVAEFLTAVRAEILAEHRNDAEGAVKVALSKGRLLSYSEGAREYLFECRNWHDSLDGVPVLARPSSSRKAWDPAEASRAPDGTVRLVTKADFGAAPTTIQIRKDDSSNWAALSERLETAGQQDSPIDAGHAGWLVGRGTPRTGRAENPGQWVADWAGLQLNPRQRDAVAQALASEVLFLWGPPGTGKTDVVGHIVEGSFRQGLKILFLAPTNVAVDQALERMCSLLEHEEGFAEGIVQRAGNIVLPSLRSRYGDQVDPGRIAALLVESIDRQISTAADQLKGARAALALHDRIRDLESDLATAVGETAAAAATRPQRPGRCLQRMRKPHSCGRRSTRWVRRQAFSRNEGPRNCESSTPHWRTKRPARHRPGRSSRARPVAIPRADNRQPKPAAPCPLPTPPSWGSRPGRPSPRTLPPSRCDSTSSTESASASTTRSGPAAGCSEPPWPRPSSRGNCSTRPTSW